MSRNLNSFDARTELTVDGNAFAYYSLPRAAESGAGDISRLPFSLKIMLENLLRHEDGVTVSAGDVTAVVESATGGPSEREIAFRPARVLMQDFTGVPAVVDLAAMRDAIGKLGGAADRINPLQDVDLVIDHSVQVDEFGSRRAFAANVDREFDRNQERYLFLKWGQRAFDNFRVVPPGTGIVHQVNLEYLAKVVFTRGQNGDSVAYPDTLVGTDSHTTMINGLGVVGWGVGGIEAEAAMLGQPVSMLIPSVVGFKMTGALPAGATATDLVLTVTQMLRAHGVVGKFVEFSRAGAGQPDPARPGHDRQHGARIRRDRGILPRRWRDADLHGADRPAIRRRSSWSKPIRKRRASSARATPPIPLLRTSWNSTWAPSNRAWQGRDGPRTGSLWPASSPPSAGNWQPCLQMKTRACPTRRSTSGWTATAMRPANWAR